MRYIRKSRGDTHIEGAGLQTTKNDFASVGALPAECVDCATRATMAAIAMRARAKGAANTPDPLTITNFWRVDHGYARSYGTSSPADPLGDTLTAKSGRLHPSQARLKNRGPRGFRWKNPSRATRRVAPRDGETHRRRTPLLNQAARGPAMDHR